MKQLFTFVFVVCTGFYSFAQSYEFRVLASRGENKVRENSSTSWSALKTGSSLFAGGEVEVVAGSYLGLMHKTGKTMEIKTPGSYSVDQLSKQVLTGGSSIASKYGEYLLSHMSKSESEDVNMERLNNMNVTGAVSRATDNEKLDVLIPEDSKLLTTQDILFRWMPNPNKEGDTYVVTILDLNGEIVTNQSTQDTWFDMSNLEGLSLEEQMGFIISVKSETDADYYSKNYALSMFEGDRSTLISELGEYQKSIPVEEESMKNIMLAMFYEKNGLKFHSMSCFTKLIVLEPENEFYAASYFDFLERNGLAEEE